MPGNLGDYEIPADCAEGRGIKDVLLFPWKIRNQSNPFSKRFSLLSTHYANHESATSHFCVIHKKLFIFEANELFIPTLTS